MPITDITTSSTSGDMFLYVKGAKTGVIKGESQDKQHQGEIDVISWTWGMQQKVNHAGMITAQKSTVSELKIVKKVDSASTALMAALKTNEPLQKVLLTLRKSGPGKVEYLKLTIEQGRVTALTLEGGDPSGGAVVLERVNISFNKITVDYVPQGNDGLPMGGMTFIDQWGEQA
jgi:type VI secretion system secreted protein Hcp